jgi:amino acid adenylation domain-containing protein
VPGEVIEAYRLSPQQQHLWELMKADSLMPSRAVCAILLEGDLDPELLLTALREVVQRHEILRTSFQLLPDGSGPLQVIAANAVPTLSKLDFTTLAPESQLTRIGELLKAAVESDLSVASDSSLGSLLVKLDSDRHMLVLSVPALSTDRTGLHNLTHEIGRAYGAGRDGPSPLEEPVQYADIAEVFNELLESAETSIGRRYWHERVSAAPLQVKLASEPDSHLSPSSSFAPRRIEIFIDESLTAQIELLAEQFQSSVPNLLFTCWQVLLWRLTAQPELLVAMLHQGRTYEGLETSLGLFAKHVPISTQLEESQSFSVLLQQVGQAVHEAFKWQEYFAWQSKNGRNGVDTEVNYCPFTFEYALKPAVQTWAGVSFSMYRHEAYSDRFKLQLTCLQGQSSLDVEVHYDANIYGPAQMGQLARQFVCLLESVVKEPATAIADLQMLPDQDRRRLLFISNPVSSYPRADLAQVFQEQVAHTPEAIALIFDEQQLTYAELNRRANQLAHHLRSLGVGPESIVGLLMRRSPDMIIALLAIVKAGAAYLPLDPLLPRERLAFMLADAAPKLLVTEERLLERVSDLDVGLLCLDRDQSLMAREAEENPVSYVGPENLAYVIYTSGSTGQPKGVTVTHRAVVRLVKGTSYVDFGADEVFLQLAPVSFDASTFEIWGSLLNGARLVVMVPEEFSLEALGAALRDHQVTTLWLTAGLFHQMVDERLEDLSGVRQLLAGGDVLSVAHVRKYLAVAQGSQRLINGYGPTENTTFSCTYPMSHGTQIGQSVPLGGPIANSSVYVLDRHLQPVAEGVAGELYLGGAGLARGYLHRAALTAEKFIPHPFSTTGGERLYRTGDMGFYSWDGTIEFLGRMDRQVKLRGFRIELGEIEATLEQQESVREAVVLAREESGDKQLVAYLVGEAERPPVISELRNYLKEKLPEYMVPSAFVILAELPLTPNGKVDRKALAAPQPGHEAGRQSYEAARNPLEEVVAGIFTEVLRVERVGVNDNFFELGGHSLLATKVTSRVRRNFAVEVELAVFFEEPTVRALSRRIELKMGGRSGDEPEQAIRPVRRETDMPLSYAQQRLWFLDQLEPGNAFYNIPLAVRLSGRLKEQALEAALNEVVRRHESLRTTFSSVDGEPRQIISESLQVPLTVTDLSPLGREVAEAEARRLLEVEAQLPFDLARGPLLRLRLLRFDEEEQVLSCTMHHIISDGWSTGILMREVAALYRTFCKGENSPLPALKIQYADFAVWQRQWLQDEALEQQLSYWRKQLAGAPPVLQLLTDHRRPASPTTKGTAQSIFLSEALLESLKKLSQHEGATLFMVLLAAFQTLLSRYTNQNDIVVGAPIAGRNHDEIEDLIGFFINTLVLRTDLSGDPTFRELLARVRRVSLEAYANQDVPFEKLVEELQPERDLGQTPLFQVMFTLQNAPREEFDLPSIELRGIEVESATTKFDLSMFLMEADGKLFCALRYKTDLFEELTIKNMLKHFETLLSSIVADPKGRISGLQMLPERESQRLLDGAGDDIFEAAPPGLCLHELFEAQARQSANATAVVYEDDQLSYRELNQKANQLARHLRELGVGPEVRVGLCLERSLEMIVALIGVLKAGGAYVPLDPAIPKERLAFMLADSQATLVLAQRRLLDRLPPSEAQIICLDQPWEWLGGDPDENCTSEVTSQNLAYLIYTSGSTGQPKGVAVEHRQVLNYLEGVEARLDFPSGGSFALVATLAADLGLTMVYPSLCRGGCLHIISQDRVETSDALADYFLRHNIDCLKIVPSHLQALLSAAHPLQVLPRQRLILGGEASRQEWVDELQALAPDCVIFNHYGPTETTVGVLTYRVENLSAVHPSGTLPLGRPIDNVQVYLLDQYLRPVPPGVPGELYIGGQSLTRGYLNQPAATGEKFIPNPFSRKPGARLYKTGDLARQLPDANLQFLGRIDHQLKVRGYRVEAGEIESVLLQHSAVREAVVVVREVQLLDSQLVAYVVPQGQQSPVVAELRTFLKERLPEYMIPGAFVVLDHLPLTLNGKVDRGALPAPQPQQEAEQRGYEAPRNPVEGVVAGIFLEVLKMERVGIHDNFFELGGHSLLATKIMSRVRHTFHVELPLRALFESPNISGLSVQIEVARNEGQLRKAPPILPVGRGDALPLSYAQQRLWFLDQLEPGNAFYNVPLAVRLSGRLKQQALEESLNEVVRRHESLRTRFVSVDGEPRQVISESLQVPLNLQDLRSMGAAERHRRAEELMREEVKRPFDLARGPLLRVQLLRLATEEHLLLLSMHHIISDGWSRGILMRELAALYNAFGRGEPSPLTDLRVQYADFAIWQRQWLIGEVLEKQLEYWRGQLTGVTALELPSEKARPAVQSFRGAMLPFSLPKEVGEKLRKLSRREGATLFMVLLAAFKVLLYRYTGQTDVVVGTPIANRERLEIEPLIGFFINTLALRTRIDPESTFRELLRAERDVTLMAYAHQDVPFEKLVEELQPERDMSRQPLFQIMFTLENATAERLEVDDLNLRGEAAPGRTSKFDLTLTIEENDQGELTAALEYSTDLFAAEAIEQMAEHFTVLLEGIVADPERQISRLPLLPAGLERRLLFDWNATEAEFPQDKCVHHLIEDQAERKPHALALIFDDRQVTYAELNTRAAEFALLLQSFGVGPEVRVGLLAERSVEMMIGLLAILKAGGAYVPLDPQYPRERLSYMLADAGVTVILTQEKLIETLPKHNARVVCLEGDLDEAEIESLGKPSDLPTPDNLAYMIYTSGSTGRPKGVLISHRNLVHSTTARFSYYKEEVKSFLLLSSFAFDSSVAGIFWTLCQGGTLLLPEQDYQQDLSRLIRLIADHQPSHMLALPSLYSLLLEQAGPEHLASLETVIVAGEACAAELIQQHQRSLPQAALFNEYGPTEGTVWSSVYQCQAAEQGTQVPIGKTISNMQSYILDTYLQPVPVGSPGQLHIGGAGLGRGYLNDSKLTSEKFVPHPFSQEPGARLYRTGDSARYLPDGNLQFLGRIDDQLKIRGYRIELGEIEAALQQHESIKEVAVAAIEQQHDDKRLVAYLVLRPEAAPDAGLLRNFLKERLPDYMHPSSFVLLEELPLTPNGKLDRRALVALGQSGAELRSVFVAPRSATECALAQIWEDLLGVTRIGIEDDFFTIGGHSLLAVRLMARIEQQFGIVLPLSTLFRGATIAELARQVSEISEAREHLTRTAETPDVDETAHVTIDGERSNEEPNAAERSPLVAIQPLGIRPPFFCVHAIGGEVLSFYHLARHLGLAQPFYGLQAAQLHRMGNEEVTISGSAREYLAAIRELQPEGPYRLGGYSYGAIVAYEMALQLQAVGEQVALLAVLDTSAPWVLQQVHEDNEVGLLVGLAWSTARQAEKYLTLSEELMQEMTAEERLRYFVEQMGAAGLAPADVEIRMLRSFLAGHRARQQAVRNYQPGDGYRGVITLFRCAEADAAMVKEMEKAGIEVTDGVKGWTECSEHVELYEVAGHHNRMCDEPYVADLAVKLGNCLEMARSRIVA